jgi:tetratricopeptide (TPR) repeat protein
VTSPTGPRSVVERQVLVASEQAQGASGEALAPYVNALIAAGNLPAARISLAQARGSVNATMPVPDLDLAEARLLSTGEEYDKAVVLADSAMKGYKAEAEAMAKKAGEKVDPENTGYGDNYYNAAQVKANALVKLSRFKEAVAVFDIYLIGNPTASDIFIDRGNAKVELKDNAGAEKDFREALRFVPYDEEAKAGLKRIGVGQ